MDTMVTDIIRHNTNGFYSLLLLEYILYMCVCVCVCVGMYVGEVGTIIDTGNENSATIRSFGFGFGTLALFG